jgi:3-dehydroquinate dehydratase/shikimate dehydrogenase
MTIEENLEIFRRNKAMADILELRTDLLNEDQFDLVSQLPSRIDLPLILTCRKVIDGGKWDSHEKGRKEWLLEWMEGGFSYIDLEMDLDDDLPLVEKARQQGITIIRSFHNFHNVPSDLFEKMTSYSHSEDVIVKGAVYPGNSEELFNLIDISLKLKNTGSMNRFILLGMGEFGFPTRILAEKLGSYLTFCSDSHGPSGAPGHCSASDLNDIYHFRTISETTVINSIIGNPLKQSRSPHIHNRGYVEKGIDAVYVPFLCDSLPWFLRTADLLNINGSSVTVPFKSEIIPLVDQTDEAVKKIGASNTIYRDRAGKWLSTNTDKDGLIIPLLKFLKTDTLKGRKVAVVGAGGAARAAVFALQEQGAQVAVFNRTLSRARELADTFSCAAYVLNESSSEFLREYSSIIIQTTNAGMAPLEEINPLSFYHFQGDETVYDIIYKPEITLLMRSALDAGCLVLGGYSMLEEQAAVQFEIFTGIVMKK